jgi:hypothetical protein
MKNNELVAIVLIALIVTVGAYFIASVIYQPKQLSNISTQLPQPTIMPPQSTDLPVQKTVVITNSEPTLPVVKISSQECEPESHKAPVVTTVLKNNGDIAITGDLTLKVYKEGNFSLGTFSESVMLPPNGEKSIEIIMYGVNYFQASTMSTEFPGLEQTPPPRKNSGYGCPAFVTG